MNPKSILRRLRLFSNSALMLSLALVLLPFRAPAQGLTLPGATATIYTGGTNKAMALTTNALFRMDVPKATDLAIWANYKFLNAPGSADDTAIRLELFRDINGALRESNRWAVVYLPGNSTTPSANVTNITVGSVGYVWGRVTNTGTNSHATNLTIYYTGKR